MEEKRGMKIGNSLSSASVKSEIRRSFTHRRYVADDMRISRRSTFRKPTGSEEIGTQVASVIDLIDEVWEGEIET